MRPLRCGVSSGLPGEVKRRREGAEVLRDSLTSGGSTSIPAARASEMWSTTLSVLEASLEMSAAMNSTG